MRKKPRATVTITAKLSPRLADIFYNIVNDVFGGNVSEAMREGIKLLISAKCIGHHKLSPEFADSFYKLVDEEFGGDTGEAVRAAVKLLISARRATPLSQTL